MGRRGFGFAAFFFKQEEKQGAIAPSWLRRSMLSPKALGAAGIHTSRFTVARRPWPNATPAPADNPGVQGV